MSLHHQFASEIRRYLKAAGRVVDPVNHTELADALALVCDRVMLTQPKVVTCVYCGMAYAAGTPTHGHNLLTAHIKVCEKHPLRLAEKELEAAKQLLLELQQAVVAFDDSVSTILIHHDSRSMTFQQAPYVAMMAKIPCRAKVIKDAKDYAVRSRYTIEFDQLEPLKAKKERRYGQGPAKKTKKTKKAK